jgi:hypothetical protein
MKRSLCRRYEVYVNSTNLSRKTLAEIIMENDKLFFKDKIIQENDVEIIFHKDYTHIYNIETFPVVKYTLINCKDLAAKNFNDIDCHNDGLLVKTRGENNQYAFEAIDMGGNVLKIICDKIIKQDLEYRKQDYVDILKEIIKQRDDEYDVVNKYYHKVENLKSFLEKEIDINERKLNQAGWLTDEKKKFLEGEQSSFRRVLELLANSKPIR